MVGLLDTCCSVGLLMRFGVANSSNRDGDSDCFLKEVASDGGWVLGVATGGRLLLCCLGVATAAAFTGVFFCVGASLGLDVAGLTTTTGFGSSFLIAGWVVVGFVSGDVVLTGALVLGTLG